MALDFNPRRAAAIVAVAGTLFGGLASYQAISGERSGSTLAVESDSPTPILRETSPKDFRHHNNVYWAAGVFGFGVGAIGIYFFLKLKECD
jgi:hypothetical protein